ncbi:MAG: hypothetical protein MUC63_08695, partial [Planctomycetes bacterium]|nr:hypothetical protein [Planctomycetota bacterium]
EGQKGGEQGGAEGVSEDRFHLIVSMIGADAGPGKRKEYIRRSRLGKRLLRIGKRPPDAHVLICK